MELFFAEAFFWRALVGVFLVSFVSAVLGSLVTVRRMNYVAGSLSHGLLGGVGIGYFMEQQNFFDGALNFIFTANSGAYTFALLSAFFLYFMKKWGKEEIALSLIWTVGMSVGVIFLYLSPETNQQLSSYLFGDLFLLSSNELFSLLGINLLLALILLFGYHGVVLMLFNLEGARAYGYNTSLLELLFLLLLSVSTVVLMKALGILLLIAIYALPASASQPLANSLRGMIGYAWLFSLISLLAAFFLSLWQDLPLGPVAVLLNAFFYFCTKVFIGFFQKTALS